MPIDNEKWGRCCLTCGGDAGSRGTFLPWGAGRAGTGLRGLQPHRSKPDPESTPRTQPRPRGPQVPSSDCVSVAQGAFSSWFPFCQVNGLGIELGDPRQVPSSPFLPGAPRLEEPLQTETKKSEAPETPLSSEEEHAGVENVKSQTYSRELLGGPPLEPWMPAALQGDQHLGAGAQGPPRQGLRLDVQSSEEEFGYIVTEDE